MASPTIASRFRGDMAEKVFERLGVYWYRSSARQPDHPTATVSQAEQDPGVDSVFARVDDVIE
jgi:hypothetical protein